MAVDFAFVVNGWVDFGLMMVKRFDDSVLIFDKEHREWSCRGPSIMWGPNRPTTPEAIDAAYQEHLAARPILAWNEHIPYWWFAPHKEGLYIVRFFRGSYSAALMTAGDIRQPIGGRAFFDILADAKAACDEHAKAANSTPHRPLSASPPRH